MWSLLGVPAERVWSRSELGQRSFPNNSPLTPLGVGITWTRVNSTFING